MLLDGFSITDRKIVTFPEDSIGVEEQVQPNGIDLRVEKIYRVHGKVTIPREGKTEADLIANELKPKEGFWKLERSDTAMYYVDFMEKVSLPDGYCGMLVTRSSLVRAGIDVMAGLWDTGFEGQLGCTLRIHNNVTIEYGAKLAQLLIFQSQFRGLRYNGRYQGSNSQSAIGT